MQFPSLLLQPEGSIDANGPITPEVVGPVTVIAGRYGQAWRCEEGTTNLVPNPRLTALLGWTPSNITVTDDGTRTPSDVPTARATISSLAVTPSLNSRTDGGTVTPGLAYSFSGLVRAGSPGREVSLQVRWYDASDAIIGGALVGPRVVTSTTGWTRVVYENVVAPATATRAQWLLRFEVNPGLTVGDVFWVGEPQVEAKPLATSYVDGDLDGCRWDGDPSESTSTRPPGSITVRSAAVLPATATGATVLIRQRLRASSAAPEPTVLGDPMGLAFTRLSPSKIAQVTLGTGQLSFGTAIANDTWVTHALVTTRATHRGYVNGVSNTAVTQVPAATLTPALDALQLGAFAGATVDIESVLVYPEALSANEVKWLSQMAGRWTDDTTRPVLGAVRRTFIGSSRVRHRKDLVLPAKE